MSEYRLEPSRIPARREPGFARLNRDAAGLIAMLRFSEREAARRLQRARGARVGLAGRWLGRVRISAKAWLAVLHALDLGLPVREAASLAEVSVPTAHKALRTVREALSAQDPAWRRLPARCAFGVVRREDGVCLRPIAGEELDRLFAALPAVLHANGFTYCAGRGGFAAFVFPARPPELSAAPRAPGARDPLLIFLKNRWAKAYGLSPEAFPLYLKEWELRFNRRGASILDDLLAAVCAPAKPRVQ